VGGIGVRVFAVPVKHTRARRLPGALGAVHGRQRRGDQGWQSWRRHWLFTENPAQAAHPCASSPRALQPFAAEVKAIACAIPAC